jgi:predicted RNase H-like HicB family nuclease
MPRYGSLRRLRARFPGAHSQAGSLDELGANLEGVIEMLLEDGDPNLSTEFVGTQTINVR